jgi:hypothetical protein
VFGDGSGQTGGFMGMLVGAGKRVLRGLFGGEGVFAQLRGSGHVWLQSLPFSRLAGRIIANLGPPGRRTGEGSVLGPIGDILRGD